MVTNKYIDSKFLEQAKAVELVKALQEASEDLNSRNLLQIGMDCPNVDKQVLNHIITNTETIYPEYPILIDVCSSSIHSLHRALFFCWQSQIPLELNSANGTGYEKSNRSNSETS